MTFRPTSILCVVALCLSSAATAQTHIALSPPDAARWSAAGLFSLAGEQVGATITPWEQWYGAPGVGAAVGYRLRRHLVLEFDGQTSAPGEIYEQRTFPVPGSPYPQYRLLTRRIRTAQAGGSILWQFLENQWVHPFLGTGALLVHESSEITDDRNGGSVSPPAPIDAERRTVVAWRPAVVAGARFYLSPRAFVRTDLRLSVASARVNLAWRSGVGIDF